jgi:glycosyltransferase involved in cell wall biosynthesis
MLLSIVTINYNNAIGLAKTIESLKNQTFSNFQYVVIDGGSDDGSLNEITKNKGKISYWVSEKDNGIYHAMNKGIQRASGSYIMFLNSGDCLSDNNILENCITYVERFPDVDIFYGDIYGTNGDGKKRWLHKHPEKLDIFFWEHCNINHQAALIKTSLFTDFGNYPSKYQLAGDHWLFLKSFIECKQFRHIPIPLVIYDCSGASATARTLYNKEMQNMWNELLPDYLRNAVAEYNKLKSYSEKKTLKILTSTIDTVALLRGTVKKIKDKWRRYRL